MTGSSVARMLQEVEQDFQLTRSFTGIERCSPRVLEAMARVPREKFVPEEFKPWAYANRPLPIGNGQTISQPYIVALMTHLLEPEPGDVVLEAGAGSLYQAAVLAQLVATVYTLEIVPALAEQAAQRAQELGLHNVVVRQGDATLGWPEKAPFDAIIVTAAAEKIPPALTEQLKPGGRLVIPVGPPAMPQNLMLVSKDAQGGLQRKNILPVAFVPFTADKGA